MAIRARNQTWSSMLVLIVAAAVWGWNEWQRSHPSASSLPPRSEETAPEPPGERPVERDGAYERYSGCTLVRDRLNDGDSFQVRLPDGREKVFRLYFVDTPESQFKRYANGETNAERIQDQANALGGISPERATELGKAAKSYVLDLLGAKPFTIFTRWDSPFNDQRYHAFVRLDDRESPPWLHERLVARGLCRIHTKGADLPDGTAMTEHRGHLRDMERQAKQQSVGAWKK